MTPKDTPSFDPHRPPAGEPLWQWRARHMVLSWFGCGLSPRAPGTVASLGALPLAAVLHWSFGGESLFIGAAILFCFGWAIARAHFANDDAIMDPQWVVVDEVAGQWLALCVMPLHMFNYFLAFALFRVFDIVK